MKAVTELFSRTRISHLPNEVDFKITLQWPLYLLELMLVVYISSYWISKNSILCFQTHVTSCIVLNQLFWQHINFKVKYNWHTTVLKRWCSFNYCKIINIVKVEFGKAVFWQNYCLDYFDEEWNNFYEKNIFFKICAEYKRGKMIVPFLLSPSWEPWVWKALYSSSTTQVDVSHFDIPPSTAYSQCAPM